MGSEAFPRSPSVSMQRNFELPSILSARATCADSWPVSKWRHASDHGPDARVSRVRRRPLTLLCSCQLIPPLFCATGSLYWDESRARQILTTPLHSLSRTHTISIGRKRLRRWGMGRQGEVSTSQLDEYVIGRFNSCMAYTQHESHSRQPHGPRFADRAREQNDPSSRKSSLLALVRRTNWRSPQSTQ